MKTKTLAGDDCVYTVPIQSDKHTLAILSEEREDGDVVFESEFSLLPFQASSFSPFYSLLNLQIYFIYNITFTFTFLVNTDFSV